MSTPSFVCVGTGIVGSTLVRMARVQGLSPMVIDAQLPESGSAASGWLLKPSWLSHLPKADRLWAFEQLEQHYGVRPVTLTGVRDLELMTLSSWAPVPPDVVGVAHETDTGWSLPGWPEYRPTAACPLVLCVGAWANDPRVTRKWGASLRFPPGAATQSRWSPITMYRQATLVVHPDGSAWFGDGTAVQHWTPAVAEQVVNRLRLRAAKLAADVTHAQATIGARAFASEKLLPHVRWPHTYWLTGAGKLGASLAPLLARRVLTELLT